MTKNTTARQLTASQLANTSIWLTSLHKQVMATRRNRDKQILKCFKAGITTKEIAHVTGLTISRVGQILTNKEYTHDK